MSRLLVVEDHPILADALRTQVLCLLPQCELFTATTLAEGLQLHQQHFPIDLVILDLNLPDSQDIATLEAFCQVRMTGPLLVFSASDHPHLPSACESSRVTFVPKSVASNGFMSAVLAALCTPQPSFSVGTNRAPKEMECHDLARLSSQQRLVLSQLAKGLSCVELASRMHISECTVRSHMHTIYQKLGVKNKSQACAHYWRWVSNQGMSPSVD